MSNQGQPGGGHQGHQTDAEAHPEHAVDELEERVLGRQMNQVRDDDAETETAHDQDRGDEAPGTEPP
jgi:hypothetical protein